MVIMHGLFGSLDNWAGIAAQLSDAFSVFLLDLRNHGRSPHVPEISYPAMAGDLLEFLDQQGIFEAHILGHSMGGKVAMQFAGSYPERVSRLVVADIAPKAYPPHHKEIFEALHAIDLDSLESRQQAQQQLEARIPQPSVVQFLLKNLGRDEQQRFRWKFNLDAISRHYGQILGNVSIAHPYEGLTCFIAGEKSNYIQPEDRPVILSHFPAAQIEYLAGAGHWVHADAPEQFTGIVRNFLLS